MMKLCSKDHIIELLDQHKCHRIGERLAHEPRAQSLQKPSR